MTSDSQSVGHFFRSQKLIFFALLAGQLLFFLLVVLPQNWNKKHSFGNESHELFEIIAPLLMVIGILIGRFIFNKRLKYIKKQDTFGKKLREYQSSLIIVWALIEGANLFAIVSYLLYPDYLFLAVTLIGLVIYVSKFPSQNKMIQNLQLSAAEIRLIQDPKTVV